MFDGGSQRESLDSHNFLSLHSFLPMALKEKCRPLIPVSPNMMMNPLMGSLMMAFAQNIRKTCNLITGDSINWKRNYLIRHIHIINLEQVPLRNVIISGRSARDVYVSAIICESFV
jgi:hypothetical protein